MAARSSPVRCGMPLAARSVRARSAFAPAGVGAVRRARGAGSRRAGGERGRPRRAPAAGGGAAAAAARRRAGAAGARRAAPRARAASADRGSAAVADELDRAEARRRACGRRSRSRRARARAPRQKCTPPPKVRRLDVRCGVTSRRSGREAARDRGCRRRAAQHGSSPSGIVTPPISTGRVR